MRIPAFFRGIGYTVRGYRIVRRYPELARYWVWPIVLTFGALSSGLYAAVRVHDDVTTWLWSDPAQLGTLGTALGALHWLLQALVFVVAAGFAIVLASAASSVIAAPFNDALSEAVERREGGARAAPFAWTRVVRDVARTVRIEAFKLALYLLVLVPSWLASFLVPGVGHALHLVFSALVTAFYLAIDYVDWPASRRGFGLRERLALFQRQPVLMLGFGFSLSILLFVPFLNLFLMPIAVAGGTRLFLDLVGPTPALLNATQRATSEPGSR
jgi:CysZ protein